MFNTLIENHENIEARFKKYFKKFWTRSVYWKNLKLRKKYKRLRIEKFN